jgi:hypothetical protein
MEAFEIEMGHFQHFKSANKQKKGGLININLVLQQHSRMVIYSLFISYLVKF